MFVRWLSIRALAVLALTCSLLVLQPATSPAYASVTVRGTYQELAAVSRSGEQQLRAVRTGHGTYWLDLGSLRAPRAGATIEVTGQRTSRRSIAVTSLKVVAEARTAPAPAAAPRSNRLLVMRVYWGAAAPAKPSTVQARSIWLTRGNAWFKEVSHARYSISGTVTRWLKISNPGGCFQGAFTAMDRAKSKARALGYRPAAYSRFVLYLPCDAGGILGLGSMPGADVWQFGSLDYKIALHEQGHNLGLGHANTRTCMRGAAQVTWSGSCAVEEYADRFDVMGNRGDGHYQAFYERRLGWLQAMSRLTATGTRTLKPYETTGPGLKAIEVRVSATKSYWLEYRTKFGIDARFPAGSFGVQIRVRSGPADSEPQLLDAMPGSGDGFEAGALFLEWDRVRLLPGSSWTSPEGVRISTLSQTASAARVSVKFRAGPARVPTPPSSATATAIGAGAKVSWTRPPDNGSIITRYVVTASPGGATRTVATVGGLLTTTRFGGLDPATSYTFGVRAHNIVGASTARRSNAVTPTSTLPSVTITAPAAGSVVSGGTTVTASPKASPGTGSPISSVDFYANGLYLNSAFAAPWSIDWDPSFGPEGPVTLTAVATDAAGAQATSPGVSVSVLNPALTITAPSAGAVLSGTSTVSYQLSPPGLVLDRAEALVFDPATGFGEFVGTSIGANGSLQIDVSLLADSPDATLSVTAFDDATGNSVSAQIPVAIANPL